MCLCAARILAERLRCSAEPWLENTVVCKRYVFSHSRLLAGTVNRQCKKAEVVTSSNLTNRCTHSCVRPPTWNSRYIPGAGKKYRPHMESITRPRNLKTARLVLQYFTFCMQTKGKYTDCWQYWVGWVNKRTVYCWRDCEWDVPAFFPLSSFFFLCLCTTRVKLLNHLEAKCLSGFHLRN